MLARTIRYLMMSELIPIGTSDDMLQPGCQLSVHILLLCSLASSRNLHGALNETYAISRGTKCQKLLFSLLLNPPPDQRVETSAFEDTINRVENQLG